MTPQLQLAVQVSGKVSSSSDQVRLRPYSANIGRGHPLASVLKPEAVIGIAGSTNHRFRVLTIFRHV
jgi:hypothetical protein